MEYKLKIGILTETGEEADVISKELYDNNIDPNKKKGEEWCIIDGICYEYVFNPHWHYDQLILKDEYFINEDPELINRLLSKSCVPAQYQIINLKQQDAINRYDDAFRCYIRKIRLIEHLNGL